MRRNLSILSHLHSFHSWLFAALLVLGGSDASGAGGSIAVKVGGALPGNPPPGYQFASVKVTIEPAAARTSGATWVPLGGTTRFSSGGSLLLLVSGAETRVLQFSTVSGFQAPIQPRITLKNGFEVDVTFTYARIVAPVLSATSTASGTRSVGFTYRPKVSGGAATSFAVTVGGGETLGTLGLSLDSTTGALSGTPAKTGIFGISFTASNTAGKSNAMVLTLTVTDPGQLTIQADAMRGSVTVSPSRPNYLFSQSDTVTLTAKPKTPAFLFAGWQFAGATPTSLTSLKTSFTFSPVRLLVVATPNFVPNPFLTRADTYTGRIAPVGGVTLANTGTLTITLTNLGTYTGKLKLGTGGYSLKGQFQTDGSAGAISLPRPSGPNLTLDQLQLDLTGGEVINGRITGDSPILFTLDRAVFDAKSNPCPQAAISSKSRPPTTAPYTMALQRDPTTPANLYPQGHGTGMVTVSPAGTVRFAGSLGDGTSLSQSAMISKTGKWPFHVLLYKNGGVLTGDLFFRVSANASDLDGTLDWIKPTIAGATVTYPQGFITQTAVIGSRYDLTAPVPNGTVRFGEGNLPVTPDPITVTSTGSLLIATPTMPGFRLRLTPTTGQFKGTLTTAASTKPLKFTGALIQKTQRGYGWFLGTPLPSGQGLPTGFVEFSTP